METVLDFQRIPGREISKGREWARLLDKECQAEEQYRKRLGRTSGKRMPNSGNSIGRDWPRLLDKDCQIEETTVKVVTGLEFYIQKSRSRKTVQIETGLIF